MNLSKRSGYEPRSVRWKITGLHKIALPSCSTAALHKSINREAAVVHTGKICVVYDL